MAKIKQEYIWLDVYIPTLSAKTLRGVDDLLFDEPFQSSIYKTTSISEQKNEEQERTEEPQEYDYSGYNDWSFNGCDPRDSTEAPKGRTGCKENQRNSQNHCSTREYPEPLEDIWYRIENNQAALNLCSYEEYIDNWLGITYEVQKEISKQSIWFKSDVGFCQPDRIIPLNARMFFFQTRRLIKGKRINTNIHLEQVLNERVYCGNAQKHKKKKKNKAKKFGFKDWNYSCIFIRNRKCQKESAA